MAAQMLNAWGTSGSRRRIASPSRCCTSHPRPSRALAASACALRRSGCSRERRAHGRKGSERTSTRSERTPTLRGSPPMLSSRCFASGRTMRSQPSGPASLHRSGCKSMAWRLVGPSWQKRPTSESGGTWGSVCELGTVPPVGLWPKRPQ